MVWICGIVGLFSSGFVIVFDGSVVVEVEKGDDLVAVTLTLTLTLTVTVVVVVRIGPCAVKGGGKKGGRWRMVVHDAVAVDDPMVVVAVAEAVLLSSRDRTPWPPGKLECLNVWWMVWIGRRKAADSGAGAGAGEAVTKMEGKGIWILCWRLIWRFLGSSGFFYKE